MQTRVTKPPNSAANLLAAGLEAYGQALLEEALELLERAEQQSKLEGSQPELAQTLIALGKVHRDLGEPTRALERLDQALELARSLSDRLLEADALNQRAGVQHSVGEYALALRDLELALTVAREFNDDRRMANCLINVGVIATKLADFPRALAALREAHCLVRDRIHDQNTEAQCLTNLGLLYEEMGDDQHALEACQLALEALAGLENRNLEAIITVNLGVVQQRLGQLVLAGASFEHALGLAREIGLAKVEISALDGLGQVHAELGQTARALELHHQALQRSRDTGDSDFEGDALLNLGRDHLQANAPQRALEPLLEALGLAQRNQRQKAQIETHKLLVEAYDQLDSPLQALEHYRQYNDLASTLFNEERERKTRQLSVQFDLERARHAAEVYRLRTELEREAKERAEAMVRQRTRELELGHQTIEQQRQALQEHVTSLRQSLQQNEHLRQRLMRAATRSTTLNERVLRRLSADLHDGPAQDLGFALLKLDGDETSSELHDQLEPIQRSISRALSEIRAIASGMCLPELESLSLEETLRRVIGQHQRRTQTNVQVTLEVTQQVPLPVKITLYRLVQESLTNAFKHGGGKGQAVRLRSADDHLHLEIQDEGPGFDLQTMLEHNERLGLAGMRERVEGLGGDFQVDTAPGKGTRIQIKLLL
jgi:signal transduction histidine kinase